MKKNNLQRNIIEAESYESIGAKAIMELRLSLNMTQRELAKTICVPTSQIAKYETLTVNPSTRALEELAQANNKKLIIKFVDNPESLTKE